MVAGVDFIGLLLAERLRTARERGWGDGQAAVGRRSVWMNVSVHSSTELGSVGARLSAAPLFSSASAPVRHFSIWRITRNFIASAPTPRYVLGTQSAH